MTTPILRILDELDALWEANDDVLDEFIGPYLARLHNSYPILSSELRRAMKAVEAVRVMDEGEGRSGNGGDMQNKLWREAIAELLKDNGF